MRPLVTLVIALAMALGAIGLAVAAPGGLVGSDPVLASAEVRAASGAVSIANSRAGQAVFSATALRPGEGVTGTVAIGNEGDVRGRFSVRAAGVQDVPGPGGGKLSERVQLDLFDMTSAASPVRLYAGPPADFKQVELGLVAPGEERVYRFAARLPQGGEDDNRFQGSALSLGFEWHATSSAGSVAPTPTRTPTPTPTPTLEPSNPTTPAEPTTPTEPSTPTPPGAPATATDPSTPTTPSTPVIPPDALADSLGLPAPTGCLERGRLRLRIKAPAGSRVLSAVVKVNGRVKARLASANAVRRIILDGLKRTTRVAVSVKASDGRTYSAARTYTACKR